MLSRTASNLYWIGRYMERAEFTSRLIEATMRLDSLQGQADPRPVWSSALAVVAASDAFARSEEHVSEAGARRYLALSPENPSSIRSCIATARDNARAARDVLTRELWEAINRAWQLVSGRSNPGGAQATLHLVEQLKAVILGFEGALSRMLRTEAYWFLKLGQMIERGDNTARLLDVKYYLLLPPGEEVGGTLDRDQWTTLLQIVSGQTAYRTIYKEGLKPLLVVDLLVFRPELPRSLTAASEETVALLGELGKRSGRQGEADRLARRRLTRLENGSVADLMKLGLHESLHMLIQESAALDRTIAQQFQFA